MTSRPFSVPPISGHRRTAPPLVDLFAGSGGLGLGLEMAGFTPVYVNELDAAAMATYVGNRLRTHPDLLRNRSFDITELTGADERKRSRVLRDWAADLRDRHGDIGLVAGGPPCQGYSGIGHRRSFAVERHEIPSNHLYRNMAQVIGAVRPRMFLFENVRNLLTARWHQDGAQGEIWADVLRAFEAVDGYDVYWDRVHARDYGVPQNRPRVLLVGIRRDLGFKPLPGRLASGLLPDPTGVPPDPVDFLGDLVDPDYKHGGVTSRYPADAATDVQRWFRCDPVTRDVYRRGDLVTEHAYSRHADRIVAKFRHMINFGGEIPPDDQTNKFAQRVLPKTWKWSRPNITATSMPDDYVHFSQPRTLTVREWARLQTFPDWYQFYGNRTTGGRRRAGDPDAGDWSRDVPKYTQIGNAVPVLLAYAIGAHFRDLLG